MNASETYSAAELPLERLLPHLARLEIEHERELQALEGDLSFGISDEEKTRAVARLKAEHEARRESLVRFLDDVRSALERPNDRFGESGR